MMDILFRTEDFVFSYRVAGLLVQDGRVLLQKPIDDDGYAVPGGHVAYGEHTDETLRREFMEELRADIRVERLAMVGEIFFPWGDKPCQQICLYYFVSLTDGSRLPVSGTFRGFDEAGGERIDLEYAWVPLRDLDKIKLYPPEVGRYLTARKRDVQRFVFRQRE